VKEKILFKSVHAILPCEKDFITCDILVNTSSGVIEKIGKNLSTGDQIEVNNEYSYKYVMPGFIDPHVHFRFPGKPEVENWFTGSKAALAGGVTTILEMPNNNPPIINKEALSIKIDHVKSHSLINYGLFGGLTSSNFSFLVETPEIKAIKVYLASTTGSLLLENIESLELASSPKPVVFHSEDETIIQNNSKKYGPLKTIMEHSLIRSKEAAISSTKKIIENHNRSGGNFHIAHISTPEEIEMLKNSKISFEVAPHHIFFSIENYRNQFLWKCNPPLRDKESADRLYTFLLKEEIPMIATDHAPHPIENKQFKENYEPASGIPSLEVGSHLILSEMFQKKISPIYAAKILATNTAERFSIEKRGAIKEGYFADLTFINHEKWTMKQNDIYSGSGWSPFLGSNFEGKICATMVNGKMYKIKELIELNTPPESRKIFNI